MRSAHFALTLVIWASCSTAYGQGQVLNKTLQHDGLTRSYTLYIPPSYTGSEAWPLVLNLHGAGGDGSWQMSNAGMNAVANTGNFLVAYPNATVSPGYGFSLWNDGSLFPNGPDDVDFISTMIDELASELPHRFLESLRDGTLERRGDELLPRKPVTQSARRHRPGWSPASCQSNRATAIARVARARDGRFLCPHRRRLYEYTLTGRRVFQHV